MLEFAEPPPRFNEVTLHSDRRSALVRARINFVSGEVCGVCVSLREFITSSGVWKSFGVEYKHEQRPGVQVVTQNHVA